MEAVNQRLPLEKMCINNVQQTSSVEKLETSIALFFASQVLNKDLAQSAQRNDRNDSQVPLHQI